MMKRSRDNLSQKEIENLSIDEIISWLKNKDRNKGKKLFDEALNIANNIFDKEDKRIVLMSIAKAQSEAGNHKGALDTINKFTSEQNSIPISKKTQKPLEEETKCYFCSDRTNNKHDCGELLICPQCESERSGELCPYCGKVIGTNDDKEDLLL